jgi:hypothetical protein
VLETTLFLPVVQVVSHFYTASLSFNAAENAKLAKELGLRPVRLHALRGQSLNDILTMR